MRNLFEAPTMAIVKFDVENIVTDSTTAGTNAADVAAQNIQSLAENKNVQLTGEVLQFTF